MKILVLDGTLEASEKTDAILDIVEETIEALGWSSETITLREKKISHCRGCFGCWVQTPGICVIPDDALAITKEMIQTDVVIYLTPIVFGGYSPYLKVQLDRSIGLNHPFFIKIDGEYHHKKRYPTYPIILGLGILESDDDELAALFRQHIQRNALNIHSEIVESSVITIDQSHDQMRASVRNLLTEVGCRDDQS